MLHVAYMVFLKKTQIHLPLLSLDLLNIFSNNKSEIPYSYLPKRSIQYKNEQDKDLEFILGQIFYTHHLIVERACARNTLVATSFSFLYKYFTNATILTTGNSQANGRREKRTCRQFDRLKLINALSGTRILREISARPRALLFLCLPCFKNLVINKDFQ